MEKNYDVIIIGAGPGGIFCAYELLEKNKDLKVLMVETVSYTHLITTSLSGRYWE